MNRKFNVLDTEGNVTGTRGFIGSDEVVNAEVQKMLEDGGNFAEIIEAPEPVAEDVSNGVS
jgi:hypothetical protein